MTDTTGTPHSRRANTTEKTNPVTFQHQQYLEYRDGMPYLPLKWQITWLRKEHPQARITTKLVTHENGLAVFKAVITLPEGGAATGWGAKSSTNESSRHEGNLDHILAAENQALSRALAALGYGTEYAQDFDSPAENQPIPLPEALDYDPEDSGAIEVPVQEDDDDEEEEIEEVEQVEPVRQTKQAANPRGEIRYIADKRASFEVPVASEPAPQPVPTPFASSPTLAAAPAGAIGNATVDERLKNIRDEALRLNIKRIYYEARQRFNYDENKVDNRSVNLYGKPTFELDATQAEQYYERILSASKKR